MIRRIIPFILILAILPLIYSAEPQKVACITMAGNYESTMQKGETHYFSFRIYNSTAEADKICEPARYTVKAEIENTKIEEIFNYEISEKDFPLENGENKRIMITLTPKINEGEYVVRITATRQEPEFTGMTMFYTTTGMIKIKLGSEGEEGTKEIPFWYSHKECPDGSYVLKEENCPEPKTDENKTETTADINLFNGKENDFIIGIGIAIIFVLGFFGIMKFAGKKNEIKS